ncbi:MAG: hypothetical protein WDN45_11680 [Caulobacteraceae bacterium]
MDRTPVTNAQFDAFVREDRLGHLGRAGAGPARLSGGPGRDADPGVPGVHPDHGAGGPEPAAAMVGLRSGRRLAPSAGA